MPETRWIALYCRVSTDEQAREGVSLEEQQERLKAYCKAMGWSSEARLYIDDGFSAKSTERPQLTHLIKSIEKNEISKVMVTKLDRLSRRLLDLLTLIDVFQKHEVSFVSISESFDTNTPSGRLTLQVLGAVAEFERERIRERVMDNMVHAAHQGKWLTQSPYGYRLENKQLVLYEPEAWIVRRVFDEYVKQGHGFFSIARRLNEEGVASRHAKEWSIRSVKLLLSNPVYKGTYRWNRIDSSKKQRLEKENKEWIIVEDCLPAIIDKETWERAQSKINSPSLAPRSQTSPHLLGGLLKCGQCGSGMSIGWSGSTNNRYRVYRCSANKNKGTCTSKQYKADEVETWFKQGLFELLESANTPSVPTLIEEAAGQQKAKTEQKLASAKSRYKRKVEAYTAGLIELGDLNVEKIRLEEAVREANLSPDSCTYNLSELEKNVQARLSNIRKAIETLPPEKAKAILSLAVKHVTVLGPYELQVAIDFNQDL
jgi:site-specific DNA recombinase